MGMTFDAGLLTLISGKYSANCINRVNVKWLTYRIGNRTVKYFIFILVVRSL